MSSNDANIARYPNKFRVIDVAAPTENVGLRKVALRRSPTAPDSWEIFVAVRNYGTRQHAVDLALQYAQSPAGSRRLILKPGPKNRRHSSTKKRPQAGWKPVSILTTQSPAMTAP